ncbi:MAG: dipeptide ABC transporter ATP-binding protein [Armatimonadetes bacterium]|nr:MAG: dipeptide ABC transporter ATP-binding protein [Armatimonadota bacterium]
MSDRPLVELTDLVKEFPVKGGVLQRQVATVNAVAGVTMSISRGETVGLVGESGCGKSTLGRLLTRLLEPTSGKIIFDGADITHLKGKQLKPFRRRVQIIFQDPYSSLDPRTQVGNSISEGLRLHGIGDKDERRDRVTKMLELVGLEAHHASRFPHEFSGGQRQRIGIARALILEPDFVVADEPVSALDVSVQAQVLNLLKELQSELDLTLLFIAHNLAVVEHISDRVAVMYLGRIAEITDRESLYKNPLHPYTEALLSAIPIPDPDRPRNRTILQGEVPSPIDPPSGCFFHPRCPIAVEGVCDVEVPQLEQSTTNADHLASCHVRTGRLAAKS